MKKAGTFKLLFLLFVFSCNSVMDEEIDRIIMDAPDSEVIELEDTTNTDVEENELLEEEGVVKLTYLALGDSYTIGASVDEHERWSEQLVKLLIKSGLNFGKPKTIAASGWTTSELKAAVINENIQEEFDLVTLLIGVNNQFRGRSLEEFRLEFRELLNTSIRFAANNPANVVVVSIPDWGVTPIGQTFDTVKLSREIDLFNDIKREESAISKVKFVDITDISRLALNKEIYVAEDGLHFSGLMYKLWAEEIALEF